MFTQPARSPIANDMAAYDTNRTKNYSILAGSNHSRLKFSNLYWSQWNPHDANARNFFRSDLSGENEYWEHMTVFPILITIMLAITVFLLILFKQSPTLVAGAVAATLTFVGVYLVLNSIHENKAKYE